MTVDEAKAYLRLDTPRDDALVGRLVESAAGLCEAFLGRRLIRREISEVLDAAPGWQRLAETPVAAITRVEQDGVPLSGDLYAVDIDPAGDGWVRWGVRGRIRVTYVAGLADDPSGVPAAIAQGITRLVAHLYAHRDDSVGPPAAVAALWRPYRRIRLGLETRA